MITRVYAHILDEDRKINAQKFESSFYSNPDLRKVRAPEETQPAVDVTTSIQQLQNAPELTAIFTALIPRSCRIVSALSSNSQRLRSGA